MSVVRSERTEGKLWAIINVQVSIKDLWENDHCKPGKNECNFRSLQTNIKAEMIMIKLISVMVIGSIKLFTDETT